MLLFLLSYATAKEKKENDINNQLNKYSNQILIDELKQFKLQADKFASEEKRLESLRLHQKILSELQKNFGVDSDKTVNALIDLAEDFDYLGKWDQAVPLLESALAITDGDHKLENAARAKILLLIGNSYANLGKLDEALHHRTRALSIYEKLGPKYKIEFANSLRDLGDNYSDLGEHEKSLSFLLKSIKIYKKEKEKISANEALAYLHLAQTYTHLSDYEKALYFQKQALRFYEESPNTKNRMSQIAWALSDIANSYSRLDQFDKAIHNQIRSLEIRKKVLGQDHIFTIRSLNNLASIYYSFGQFQKALPIFIRCLEIQEKIHGNDHPNTIIFLNNVAKTYSDLDLYEQALPLNIRALEISEKILGLSHPGGTAALEHLAATYFSLGQYEKALPLQMRALSNYENMFSLTHPSTATALNNLALTYSALAQYDKALPLKTRALEIFETSLGKEHSNTAVSLLNLASTFYDLDQYEKALSLQIRALSIYEKILGPVHPNTATALNNLALTYSALDQNEKALSLLIRVLDISEKTRGTEHLSTALASANLAQIYDDLGKADKVPSLQIRALAIYENVLGFDHPTTARVRFDLGLTTLTTDRSDLGIVLLKSAVNSFQVQRQMVSGIGSSELKSYSQSLSVYYQKLADALIARGRLPEAQVTLDMLKEDEQFDFIRRAANADSRNSKIGYTNSEQVWLKRYREISDQLGKLGAESRELEEKAKLGLNSEQKNRQREVTADLRVAKAAFEQYLVKMREGLSKGRPSRMEEVEEISAQAMGEAQSLLKELGDDVALVQYYVTDTRVGMLLTTSGIQLARSSEIELRELNRLINELRRSLQNPKSDPVPIAQRLYKILVSPISKDLEVTKVRTVMLSLDGPLRYLPFAALHDGKQYLVQHWNLPIYTSVSRAKLRDKVSSQWRAAGLGVTKAWPEFSALAGVKSEITAIVKTPSGGLMPGEIYLDEEFTATQFKEVSQRKFPLMHVASHFRFSPGTEMNSFLLLGDGQRLTIGDIRTQNYRFDNVDLLTLSACDTGLGGGRDEQGKEIEGFGVIAQQQGAKSVLATLWQVSDQSTAMLMADLYRRRQSDKLTKVEALRQSQISLQASLKYSHPFYWAPFILMGNWK
jgi:CHAT domain-containing protein